jgi:hypothetical protein
MQTQSHSARSGAAKLALVGAAVLLLWGCPGRDAPQRSNNNARKPIPNQINTDATPSAVASTTTDANAERPIAHIRITMGGGKFYALVSGRKKINSSTKDALTFVDFSAYSSGVWRQIHDINLFQGSPERRRATINFPFYSFLPPSDRNIDLGVLEESECSSPQAPEPFMESDLIRSSQFWRNIVAQCITEDNKGYAFLFALSKALYAEKKLVNKWPDQYVIDTELWSLADNAVKTSRSCKTGNRKPVCDDLNKEVEETINLDFLLYRSMSRFGQKDLDAMSNDIARDFLTGIRIAEEAYNQCRTKGGTACRGADFPGLRDRICTFVKERNVTGKENLCRGERVPSSLNSAGGTKGQGNSDLDDGSIKL